jgi:hypothetical protein
MASTSTSTTTATSETTGMSKSNKNRKRDIPVELRGELNFETKVQELLTEYTENIKPLLRDHETKLKNLLKYYNQDISVVYRSKNKRSGDRKETGFVKKILLPEGMAKLINETHGTYMSLPEYTKRFYRVLEERNLRYEQNKKVFRADAEILRVFNLPETVNKSTNPDDKDGFNFHTLQKIFSQVCKGAPREDTSKTATATATATTTTETTTVTQQATQKAESKTVETEPKQKVTVRGKKKETAPVASA